MLTLHKVKSKVSPGVGTSSGSRIDQNLLRCLAVSCADETYWPGVTPSNRLKRCVKWLCVIKPRSCQTLTHSLLVCCIGSSFLRTQDLVSSYPYASPATEPGSVAREIVLSSDHIVASTVLPKRYPILLASKATSSFYFSLAGILPW